MFLDQFDLVFPEAFLIVSCALGIAVGAYLTADRAETVDLGDVWWQRFLFVGKVSLATLVIVGLWAAYLYGWSILFILLLAAGMAAGAALFTMRLLPVAGIISGVLGIAAAVYLITTSVTTGEREAVIAGRQLDAELKQKCSFFLPVGLFETLTQRCISNHSSLHQRGRASLVTHSGLDYLMVYKLPPDGDAGWDTIAEGERTFLIKFLREDYCKKLEEEADKAYLAEKDGVPQGDLEHEVSLMYAPSARKSVALVLINAAYRDTRSPSELRRLARYLCLTQVGAALGATEAVYGDIWPETKHGDGQGAVQFK